MGWRKNVFSTNNDHTIATTIGKKMNKATTILPSTPFYPIQLYIHFIPLYTNVSLCIKKNDRCFLLIVADFQNNFVSYGYFTGKSTEVDFVWKDLQVSMEQLHSWQQIPLSPAKTISYCSTAPKVAEFKHHKMHADMH